MKRREKERKTLVAFNDGLTICKPKGTTLGHKILWGALGIAAAAGAYSLGKEKGYKRGCIDMHDIMEDEYGITDENNDNDNEEGSE